jgi:two-component system CheB/CheR fusion protein
MARLEGVRVLLVDDTEDIRDVFAEILAADGAEVTAVGCGRDAVDIARKSEFDLRLTDLSLPDISGDLVIRLVTAAAGRRPRVVVVTAHGEPFLGRAREAGADLVFTKPIALTHVIDRLVSLLERRGAA